MSEIITPPLDLLETILILSTLFITSTRSIRQIIIAYQMQSGLLAVVTVLTALTRSDQTSTAVVILILLVAVLPLMLTFFIRPLLVRATLSTPVHGLAYLFNKTIQAKLTDEAERIWHQYKVSRRINFHLFVSLGLIFGAFFIAFNIIAGGFDQPQRIGLAVSMVLHLTGLYNMVVKHDIISQVVGLLIMDHGLYLAVVKIVKIPFPATFFVIGLYFYTLITVFILVILLPRVRQVTESIDMTEILAKSSLKG